MINLLNISQDMQLHISSPPTLSHKCVCPNFRHALSGLQRCQATCLPVNSNTLPTRDVKI